MVKVNLSLSEVYDNTEPALLLNLTETTVTESYNIRGNINHGEIYFMV